MDYDRVFVWGNNAEREKLVGRRCRVVAHGSSMQSVLVEFEDGTRVVTSRRATRRAKKEAAEEAPRAGGVNE